ncbi:TPA: hypothetical protein QCR51_005851 [Bacillus cereus]|nr:hypothetical protein [Bacillus cereus]
MDGHVSKEKLTDVLKIFEALKEERKRNTNKYDIPINYKCGRTNDNTYK